MKYLPALLTIALGGFLMTRTNRKSNPTGDDLPTSFDYEDPELKSMLSEEDSEDDSDESEDQPDDSDEEDE